MNASQTRSLFVCAVRSLDRSPGKSVSSKLLPTAPCRRTTCVCLQPATFSRRRPLSTLTKTQQDEKNKSTSSKANQIDPKSRKRLDVAIVGLPNAGKSQLLNVLTGTTVSAVSRKRHTTREGILGARTVENTQLLFVDTPGFLRHNDRNLTTRDRADLRVIGPISSTAARQAVHDVDYTLLVVDAARRLTDDVQASLVKLMMYALQSQGRDEVVDESDDEEDDNDNDEGDTDDKEYDDSDSDWSSDEEEGGEESDEMTSDDEEEDEPDDEVTRTAQEAAAKSDQARQKFAVVLNKVDLVYPKSDLLDIAMQIGELAEECIRYHGQENPNALEASQDPEVIQESLPTFFYISALKEDGVDDLVQFLLEKATPSRSWELEPGEATSLTPEERVEEVIREKIYRALHQEVPYHVKQENRLFRVAKDNQGRHVLCVHQDILVQTQSHLDLVRGSGGRTLERIQEASTRDLMKMFGCKVLLHLHVKLVKSKQRKWSI